MNTMNFERTINHVIANGARIHEGGLGTILPTRKQLKAMDRHADSVNQKRDEAARKLPALSKCNRRVEGGEVRYYASTTKFAVVGRSGALRWFEVRKNGVFAV